MSAPGLKGKESSMSERRRLSLIANYTVLMGLFGLWGCSTGLHNTIVTPPLPDTKQVAEKGCLSCHEGIEIINDNMQPFLLSFAKKQYGKGSGYECAICHEGNPSSIQKEDAHNNLIPNPSSMWILHKGKGCAKCHDSKGSITTLMGKPLDQPVGSLCPSNSFHQNLPGY